MKKCFLPLCLALLLLNACSDPDLSQVTAGKNLDLSKTVGTVTTKTVVILKGDQDHTKSLAGAPCNTLSIRLPGNSSDTVFSCVSEENYNAVLVNDSLPTLPLATAKVLATLAGVIVDRSFDPGNGRWYIVVWDYEKHRIFRVPSELYYKLDAHQRLPLELN